MSEKKEIFEDPVNNTDVCDIVRKLDLCKKEFPEWKLKNAVVLSCFDEYEEIGGFKNIYAPTISTTLGNVPFNVARFFENL
jgi:hypothetical protein